MLLALALTPVSGRHLADEVAFWIPSLRVDGTIRRMAGHRLFVVTATLGEEAIADQGIAGRRAEG
jgi:hypothetical protein